MSGQEIGQKELKYVRLMEDLKEKIIASKCTKIELLHNDAMKDMKDSVTELLNDIENILNIEVNYNDD